MSPATAASMLGSLTFARSEGLKGLVSDIAEHGLDDARGGGAVVPRAEAGPEPLVLLLVLLAHLLDGLQAPEEVVRGAQERTRRLRLEIEVEAEAVVPEVLE